MKRSDMLEDIASQIVMDYPIIPWDGAQILAEVILKRCEHNGMLPPPYINTELGDHMNFYEINQWEPENEN